MSATAGEKCDTDISLLRYDSPEICAYSSNQNSDSQLTSACVALWRSAVPQSTCVIRAGQWYPWFEGWFFFFPARYQIRRLGISRTLHGAIIQQYVLIRPLRSTFPWTRACLLLMSRLSRPPPLPSRPCSGRDEMEQRSVNQQPGFAVIKCSGGDPFWEHKIKMMPRSHLWSHLMCAPSPRSLTVRRKTETRIQMCVDHWTMNEISARHTTERVWNTSPLTPRKLI